MLVKILHDPVRIGLSDVIDELNRQADESQTLWTKWSLPWPVGRAVDFDRRNGGLWYRCRLPEEYFWQTEYVPHAHGSSSPDPEEYLFTDICPASRFPAIFKDRLPHYKNRECADLIYLHRTSILRDYMTRPLFFAEHRDRLVQIDGLHRAIALASLIAEGEIRYSPIPVILSLPCTNT